MAEIKPFRGILYNREKIDISKVVTPPYDIISPAMQNRFYKKDEHNIIKLILGKEKKADTPNNNKYTRSGMLLNNWLRKRFLVKDRKPSIYIYTHQYLHKGKKKIRIGFIALMKIEDPRESGVLPHEYTLDKPKADRLNLVIKTKANLCPIFSLFQDTENKIDKLLKHFIKSEKPLFTIDTEGVIHKLWRLDDRIAINKIKAILRDKKIYIADGHHRYEVALAYRNRMRKSRGFKKAMNYVMIYFSNLNKKGNPTILSTHRVVKNIGRFDKKKLVPELKRFFYIKNINDLDELLEKLERRKKTERIFGMYTGRERFYLLTLKDASSVEKIIESKKANVLKRLDVTILHDLIIEKILGVKNTDGSIKYIRNEKDASSLIDKSDYEIAFFLRPIDAMDMKAVAEKGELMPRKSTYFYPKLLTGLVINKF